MSLKVVKSPEMIEYDVNTMDPSQEIVIFTAGSIEMGKAEDWQSRLAEVLKDSTKDVTLLNPRRDDWDSSWVQSINNPQFNEQVTWELSNLERCHLVVMYFVPGTISPISLMELGLFANKCVVYCPEGFERKGNVDIVCQRYNIPVYEDENEYFEFLKGLCNK